MAPQNIILVGFMGTGKSATGKVIAEQLGYRLVDIDEEIEREQGMTIARIFQERGEPAFRDAESAVIMRLGALDGAVIATGGGAVLRAANIEALRRAGTVVCLQASPETILERTKGTTDRPLLRGGAPLARIRELLEARRPFYESADVVVQTDNGSPLEIAEQIIETIRLKEKRLGHGKE